MQLSNRYPRKIDRSFPFPLSDEIHDSVPDIPDGFARSSLGYFHESAEKFVHNDVNSYCSGLNATFFAPNNQNKIDILYGELPTLFYG